MLGNLAFEAALSRSARATRGDEIELSCFPRGWGGGGALQEQIYFQFACLAHCSTQFIFFCGNQERVQGPLSITNSQQLQCTFRDGRRRVEARERCPMFFELLGKLNHGDLTSPKMRNYQEATNPTMSLTPGKISSQFLMHVRVRLRHHRWDPVFSRSCWKLLILQKHMWRRYQPSWTCYSVTAGNFPAGAGANPEVGNNKHLGRRINEPKPDSPAESAPESVGRVI